MNYDSLKNKTIIIDGKDVEYIEYNITDGHKIKCNNFIYDDKGLTTNNSKNLPEKYIINKDATILFWNDNIKTIVKRAEDDKFDKRIGFLYAYFLKNSGLTRTQANKFINELVVNEKVKEKK